jgi:hypothetical protein
MKARGGGDGPVWRVAFVAMPTPSGGDWARGSRGGGLRAPAGRGSAGVILLGGGSPDLTACGSRAGVHGRCMLVIWRAASRRIKGPRGPRRLTPHAMGALSACATSACGHVGMRPSGVHRGDSRTSRRRSRRRICSVPSSSSQCASARSTRRSTCPQLACACCGLNERLFASRQCKAQITLSAAPQSYGRAHRHLAVSLHVEVRKHCRPGWPVVVRPLGCHARSAPRLWTPPHAGTRPVFHHAHPSQDRFCIARRCFNPPIHHAFI